MLRFGLSKYRDIAKNKEQLAKAMRDVRSTDRSLFMDLLQRIGAEQTSSPPHAPGRKTLPLMDWDAVSSNLAISPSSTVRSSPSVARDWDWSSPEVTSSSRKRTASWTSHGEAAPSETWWHSPAATGGGPLDAAHNHRMQLVGGPLDAAHNRNMQLAGGPHVAAHNRSIQPALGVLAGRRKLKLRSPIADFIDDLSNVPLPTAKGALTSQFSKPKKNNNKKKPKKMKIGQVIGKKVTTTNKKIGQVIVKEVSIDNKKIAAELERMKKNAMSRGYKNAKKKASSLGGALWGGLWVLV